MNLVITRWWSTFFMPSAVLLAMIAVGAVWCLWSWKRGRGVRQSWIAVALLVDGILLLYLASTPLVARWAAEALERRNPPVSVANLPEAGAIVVLGGAMYATEGPDGTVHLYARHASDRFESAMSAFEAGKARLIAFGGGSSGVEGTPTEGEWNRGRAIARGVPPEQAICGGAARYTSDEASILAAELRARSVSRIILATSAMHMPRALRTFQALGLEVIPLPCDFATRGEAEVFSPMLLVPRGLALAQVDACAKEILGLAVTGR